MSMLNIKYGQDFGLPGFALGYWQSLRRSMANTKDQTRQNSCRSQLLFKRCLGVTFSLECVSSNIVYC